MKRRNFLKSTLAVGAGFVAERMFSITKYFDPNAKKLPPTKIVDKKLIENGVGGMGLFNAEGDLISRIEFEAIHMNTGDILELTYKIQIV
jgi:hypothetical protein